MKGRKAIPNKIIELRGGTQHTHRKARAEGIDPPSQIPTCPAHLDLSSKREWRRVVKILDKIKLITELDRSILAEYCEGYGKWVSLKRELSVMKKIDADNDVVLKDPSQRVEQYRSEVRRWKQAMKKNEKGIVFQKANGEPGVSPYLSIEREAAHNLNRIDRAIKIEIKEAEDRMYKALRELGMTPSARASLSIHQQPTTQASDKTAMFRKLKHGKG